MVSPSSRRAWIEIQEGAYVQTQTTVALLAEGVDRNCIIGQVQPPALVALLAEGVDRNLKSLDRNQRDQVALLAEGVDRNPQESVRNEEEVVALLAEGVDRNRLGSYVLPVRCTSPSSRRAWIEIRHTTIRRC